MRPNTNRPTKQSTALSFGILAALVPISTVHTTSEGMWSGGICLCSFADRRPFLQPWLWSEPLHRWDSFCAIEYSKYRKYWNELLNLVWWMHIYIRIPAGGFWTFLFNQRLANKKFLQTRWYAYYAIESTLSYTTRPRELICLKPIPMSLCLGQLTPLFLWQVCVTHTSMWIPRVESLASTRRQ